MKVAPRTRFMIIEYSFWLQMFPSSMRVASSGKLFRFSLARSLFAVTFTIWSLSSIRTAYIWERAENFPSKGAAPRRFATALAGPELP